MENIENIENMENLENLETCPVCDGRLERGVTKVPFKYKGHDIVVDNDQKILYLLSRTSG